MTITSSCDGGALTLAFEGELDHHAAREAMLGIERDIERYLPRACVLDLARLSFMDSSGIAVILKAHRRMAELGGTASVVGAGKQPYKVLDAAGLRRLVKIETTV